MFDSRWGDDPRDRDDNSRDLSRGSRGGSDPRERERVDPRDVFMEHVSLPRGLEREHVHHHGHDYTLRGSETRTLTTVGAFRAVPAGDLRDTFDRPLDPRHGELWHLRDSGLVQTVRLDRDHTVVTLTKEGRDLLESRRVDDDSRDRQAFHAGVPKPRELKHDAELYRAYTEEAERLRDEGANIHRIVLENDLKREYQEFLQERNRDCDDSDGRPDRDPLEIQDWARESNGNKTAPTLAARVIRHLPVDRFRRRWRGGSRAGGIVRRPPGRCQRGDISTPAQHQAVAISLD